MSDQENDDGGRLAVNWTLLSGRSRKPMDGWRLEGDEKGR